MPCIAQGVAGCPLRGSRRRTVRSGRGVRTRWHEQEDRAQLRVFTPCDFIAAITQHTPDKELPTRRMSLSASCAISGSGKRGGACIPAPTRPKRPSIRGSTTPSPTTTPNRSWRCPPPETSGSAQVRLSHPLFSGPQPSGGSFFDLWNAPRNPKRPVFDFRAHFCHSAPMETHAFGFTLRANAPEGQKRFPISCRFEAVL